MNKCVKSQRGDDELNIVEKYGNTAVCFYKYYLLMIWVIWFCIILHVLHCHIILRSGWDDVYVLCLYLFVVIWLIHIISSKCFHVWFNTLIGQNWKRIALIGQNCKVVQFVQSQGLSEFPLYKMLHFPGGQKHDYLMWRLSSWKYVTVVLLAHCPKCKKKIYWFCFNGINWMGFFLCN